MLLYVYQISSEIVDLTGRFTTAGYAGVHLASYLVVAYLDHPTSKASSSFLVLDLAQPCAASACLSRIRVPTYDQGDLVNEVPECLSHADLLWQKSILTHKHQHHQACTAANLSLVHNLMPISKTVSVPMHGSLARCPLAWSQSLSSKVILLALTVVSTSRKCAPYSLLSFFFTVPPSLASSGGTGC